MILPLIAFALLSLLGLSCVVDLLFVHLVVFPGACARSIIRQDSFYKS